MPTGSGNRFVIDGRKHWITGGVVAPAPDLRQVYDGAGAFEGIGGFLGSRRDQGPEDHRARADHGAARHPEAVIRLRGIDLPPLGAGRPARGLNSFADLMTAYDGQRIGAATVALGITARSLPPSRSTVGARASSSPGRSTVPGLQRKLADISSSSRRRRRWSTTRRARAEAAFPYAARRQAKVFTSESTIQVVNEALQVFGARRYSRERRSNHGARRTHVHHGRRRGRVLTTWCGREPEEEAAADASTARRELQDDEGANRVPSPFTGPLLLRSCTAARYFFLMPAASRTLFQRASSSGMNLPKASALEPCTRHRP